MHAAPETQDVPIIVVSGAGHDKSLGGGRDGGKAVLSEAGIVDWIVKPFNRDRLVHSVEKAASSHLRLAHSA